MTLFGRLHRPRTSYPLATTWAAAALGMMSLLLARASLRLSP